MAIIVQAAMPEYNAADFLHLDCRGIAITSVSCVDCDKIFSSILFSISSFSRSDMELENPWLRLSYHKWIFLISSSLHLSSRYFKSNARISCLPIPENRIPDYNFLFCQQAVCFGNLAKFFPLFFESLYKKDLKSLMLFKLYNKILLHNSKTRRNNILYFWP